MSEIRQISGIASIMLLMMFSLATIIDSSAKEDVRKQSVLWALTLAIIISQAIW